MKLSNGQSLLLGLIRRQWRALVLPVIANLLISAMGTAGAIASRSLVDSATAGIANGSLSGLVTSALVYGSLIVGQLILYAIQRYATERCSASLERQLQMDYYDVLLTKTYDDIRSRSSGVMQTHMTGDIYVVRDAVTNMLPTVAGMLGYLVFSFAALLIFDWRFALFFMVLGIVVFFFTRILRGRLKSLHWQVQTAEEKKRNFQQETMDNLLVIRVFGVADRMRERMKKLQDNHVNIRCRRARFSTIGNFCYGLFMNGGYLLAFCWCAIRLFYGTITVGTLTAILQLVGQVQRPFSSASGLLSQYYSAVTSAERLSQMLELPEEPVGEEPEGKFVSLRGNGLHFSYDREEVLSDASFSIHSGEIVALTGRSGIGKSTLFRLLLGAHTAEQGTLELVTEEGTYPLGCSTRSYFSYLPQGNFLFSGSLRDNLLLVRPDATEEELQSALTLACADEFVNTLPHGIDTVVGEHGMGLSEGQAQRIGLARAILRGAPVLLLDEATSALDEVTEAQVLQNLKKIPGLTCIMVTHRPGGLLLCDRQLVLSGGKISEKTE